MSRSSLEPGKVTTPQRTLGSLLDDLDAEILDHAVGQELRAHAGAARGGLGAVDVAQAELDVLPDPHLPHLRVAESVQRVLHCLALGIEDAASRGDGHPRQQARHQAASPQMRRAASWYASSTPPRRRRKRSVPGL